MSDNKTINVIVLKDGITAKEVNPLGSEVPKPRAFETSPAQFNNRKRDWLLAENNLRTFEIDMRESKYKGFGVTIPMSLTKWESGIKHEAEILPNGKIKLL